MSLWTLLIATLTAGAAGTASASEAGAQSAGQSEPSGGVGRQIAVVIDDFGNNMKGTAQMLDLPIKLTAAVMPFLPSTKRDAEAAFQKGHEVIVHMPMEPVKGRPNWLGPNAILTSLSDEEIRKRVEMAISDVPHAVGMNNHMGSKATADERVMRIVLQVCKEKGLFFLDSRTSYKSVIPKVAAEVGIPLLRNNVFLDDVYTTRHVSKQLQIVREHLGKHESCVTIGHVGPSGLITSGALREAIPQLERDARFVKLTQLLPPDPPLPANK